ncbi:hypothetical protein FJTKL_01089 [Diaporthe vaccinii]|uniref:DUF7924 domain-containing protein n=1 Tax=Diaporthe vaccinii TaxID=105482 RepID=A0ABR4F4Z0_9PEZI
MTRKEPPPGGPKSTQKSTPGERGPRTSVSQLIPPATRRATRSTTKPEDLESGHRIQSPSPKPRSRKAKAVVSPIATNPEQERRVLQTVETGVVEAKPSTPKSLETDTEDSLNWDSDERHVEKEPLQVYYERIGYLPPLDDATMEVLSFMSMSNPDVDVEAGRVSPQNIPLFRKGLLWRMVDIEPNDGEGFQINEMPDVTHPLVPENIKDYDEKLWEKDLEKCQKQVQEAIFQRTMLLSMIDRYRLFYGYPDTTEQSVLEFAVETPWTCLPMPTHAERRGKKFLTSPKPDLAVGFRRQKLFQDCDWNSFPEETQRLICYEGDGPPNVDRAFYFLTIEAKRGFTSVDDPVALNQCLNNASQALHNMFEFFKEADREIGEGVKVKKDEYTKKFFERVRFFSVVAVAGAMKIRVHRACKLDQNDEKGPKSDYPLKFVFSDYKEVSKKDFTRRQSVVEELTRILHNYGVNELAGLLKDAIKEMDKKFVDYSVKGRVLSRGPLFYSYNQAVPPARKSGKSTPRATPTPTIGSQTPVPGNGPKGYHRPRSSALSLSQSISDDLGQLNVAAGASGDPGQTASGRVEDIQELGTTRQEEALDTGVSGSPKKKRKR